MKTDFFKVRFNRLGIYRLLMNMSVSTLLHFLYFALPIAVDCRSRILSVFLVCRLKRYSYACSVNSCARLLFLQPTDCPDCHQVLQTSRSADLLVFVQNVFLHSHDLSRSLNSRALSSLYTSLLRTYVPML